MRRVLVPLHVPDIAPLVPRAAQIVSLGGETMGTSWSVKAATAMADHHILSIVENALALVIAQMSQWEPDSDISRFNRSSAGTWHMLPDEFFSVLRCALDLARDTDGAYDPTIGALSDLWGFGASGRRIDVPDRPDIDAARQQCGRRDVRLDHDRRAVLQPGSVQLDLSSIAKGFAVDLVSETLSKRGITDHLVEIGGELRGSGVKPDGSPWWVALEGGDGAADDMIVALHGLSVATSGDVRRHIKDGGRKLSHTLDPRTGWPVSDKLTFVTVFDRSGMKADALATALTVLGPEEGYDFAAVRDIAARFIIREATGLQERMTPAFAAMLD
jgi:thiamine biosynthesis lipoprotein